MPDMTNLSMKRFRKRRPRVVGAEEKQKIVSRVLNFATRDIQDRREDMDRREQRQAKLRQWTEGKTWPWPEASDQAIPDMATTSLRMQDTLHNAVMSQRPAVVAQAVQNHNVDKETSIDDLLDYQFFIEQRGEKIVEELASEFVDEGHFVAFVPWVRETRKFSDVKHYDPIPEDQIPIRYFQFILSREFPGAIFQRLDKDGWDWSVTESGTNQHDIEVYFYSYEDRVEVEISMTIENYNGPRIIVKSHDEVLYPHRAANLQPPSPSNPGGAAHVILVDFPTVDEILRLRDSKFYEFSDEDANKLKNVSLDKSDDTMPSQKDSFQGTSDSGIEEDYKHRVITRYMCFDVYDLDKDGKTEDVIWWVLKEPGLLVKSKMMTEMYPIRPPRRPLAEACCLPVKGRLAGIGIPELMEGLHDLKKQIIDMTIDAGAMQTIPFGFYRPTSNIRPEVYRMGPGDMAPVNDPKNDISFPVMSNNAMSFGINMMTVADQMEEKLTLVGDMQFGRVPYGKASALRTMGGMQTILGQGEARPERVLRRFFMGLTDIWSIMHSLNKEFLTGSKKFRVIGYTASNKDPYREVQSKDLDGTYQFDFKANVLNSSKMAKQQALGSIMPMYVNPLTMQLGIMDAEHAYSMLYDFGEAHGITPNKYIKEPFPGANSPKILAEEALSAIFDFQIPYGRPLEPAQEHLAKLQEFAQSDEFGLFDKQQIDIFKIYMQQIAMAVQMELRQQKMMAAADQFAQESGRGGGQGGGGGQNPRSPTYVNDNELLDETMPAARGGE